MISLKNMVNEAYSLEVSRKVRATIQMNIRNGCFVGSIAPYGYFKSESDCHKLVVDPYAAGIVRSIFEMAANGQSHGAILEWLNNNDIIPPMRYLYTIGITTEKTKGATTRWWSLRAVRDTLRNQMYCGDMVQGKKRMEGGVEKRLPPSEWMITENTHVAIVNREVFAEVQKFWDKPKSDKEPYYKGENTEDIFRAKIYCGDCGAQVFRKRTGDKSYAYLCTVRRQYSTRACGGMRSTENLLKATVLEQLLGSDLIALLQAPSIETATLDSEVYKSELTKIKSDAEKNSHYLKGLYESLMLGDISDIEYRELKSIYESRVASLSEQESTLRENIQISLRKEKALEQARNSTVSVKTIADLTKDIIDQTIEKIIVYDKYHIEVTLRNFGVETTSDREGASNE